MRFRAGDAGDRAIEPLHAVRGPALPFAARLAVAETPPDAMLPAPEGGAWTLDGVTSNRRYSERAEVDIRLTRVAA